MYVKRLTNDYGVRVRVFWVMLFNATFNNIVSHQLQKSGGQTQILVAKVKKNDSPRYKVKEQKQIVFQ